MHMKDAHAEIWLIIGRRPIAHHTRFLRAESRLAVGEKRYEKRGGMPIRPQPK